MSPLIHIVPSVPPEFNGLGDYCHSLWRHWPELEPAWHIATARMPLGAREAWPEVQIDTFELRAIGLFDRLRGSGVRTAVLHYVGYGYDRRGAPAWLPRAIRRWKADTGGKVVVMFHELYATGPPWKSEFWYCLPQWKVARDLVGIADRWVTSCPRYMKVLESCLGADAFKGEMIPVPTNIDVVEEPNWQRPWPLNEGKKLHLVVFGLPLTRRRSLNKHAGLISYLVKKNSVASIVLIGKGDQADPAQAEITRLMQTIAPGVEVKSVYSRPSIDISHELIRCDVGLVSNPADILYKSGVHAAYACHGLITIVPGDSQELGPTFVTNIESNFEAVEMEMPTTFTKLRESARQFSAASVAARFAEVVNSV